MKTVIAALLCFAMSCIAFAVPGHPFNQSLMLSDDEAVGILGAGAACDFAEGSYRTLGLAAAGAILFPGAQPLAAELAVAGCLIYFAHMLFC